MGDRLAREALQQPEPDRTAAYDGFLKGSNHPEDIPGMIRLFRYFGGMPYFKEAIDIWRQGDEIVELIHQTGMQIKQAVISKDPKKNRSTDERIGSLFGSSECA